jgi:hypothetical protein
MDTGMNSDTPSLSIPRPGLVPVVEWMRKFAIKGSSDLDVRRQVELLCAGVHPGDYASEILAIYYWVHANIRYMRDIYDVEFLKEPRMLLQTKSGDCDDIATLLAAMLMAAGNKCAFCVVGFNTPSTPSHVFVAVQTPKGPVAVDPVAGAATSRMAARITGMQVFQVNGAPGEAKADAF